MGDQRHTPASICTPEPAWEQEAGAWGLRIAVLIDPSQASSLAHSGPATPQGSWGKKGVLITQSSKQSLPARLATDALWGEAKGQRESGESSPP